MAIHREPLWCHVCGELIQPKYADKGKDFVGDTFNGYEDHICKKAPATPCYEYSEKGNSNPEPNSAQPVEGEKEDFDADGTFEDYIINAKNEFVELVIKYFPHETDRSFIGNIPVVDFRVGCENILIAYDQMIDRILSNQGEGSQRSVATTDQSGNERRPPKNNPEDVYELVDVLNKIITSQWKFIEEVKKGQQGELKGEFISRIMKRANELLSEKINTK